MAPPLYGRRPKRREKPPKLCMTQGCNTVLAHRWKWLCDACWRRLPFERRRTIAEACQAREPQRIFGLCRDAAEWLVDQRLKLVGEG